MEKVVVKGMERKNLGKLICYKLLGDGWFIT